MRWCRSCGAALGKRSQRVYCSAACQQAMRQRLLLESWLRTGAAAPGTKANHYIRLYLAEQQGGQCALCRLQSEWEGKPLRFVLDHVDGDSTNNRRGNLRLVCPNCDSQLPTYKSRNRGRGRHSRRLRYAEGKSY